GGHTVEHTTVDAAGAYGDRACRGQVVAAATAGVSDVVDVDADRKVDVGERYVVRLRNERPTAGVINRQHVCVGQHAAGQGVEADARPRPKLDVIARYRAAIAEDVSRACAHDHVACGGHAVLADGRRVGRPGVPEEREVLAV